MWIFYDIILISLSLDFLLFWSQLNSMPLSWLLSPNMDLQYSPCLPSPHLYGSNTPLPPPSETESAPPRISEKEMTTDADIYSLNSFYKLGSCSISDNMAMRKTWLRHTKYFKRLRLIEGYGVEDHPSN